MAAVRRAHETRRRAGDIDDLLALKPCLIAKYASGPPLTLEAVTHRNSHGLALAGKVELSAITGGVTNTHEASTDSNWKAGTPALAWMGPGAPRALETPPPPIACLW
jgi:hypothetical protein